jgi:hypothetical protein
MCSAALHMKTDNLAIKTQRISVFGNEIDAHDNTAIQCLPLLRKRFLNIEFLVQDPTESLKPLGDPWVIIDTAIGIDHVTVIDSLDQLEYVKGSSVHDFDVYMELRLQAKLAPLPKLKIILVPQGDDPKHATEHIYEILSN